MKYIRKIVIAKYNVIFPIVINIVLITIMLSTNNIYYETVDDYMMQEIAAGYYGEYSEYILQMNIIIGKIITLLFTKLPSINWYFIFLAILQFIGFTTIGSYLIKEKGKKLGSLLYATIIILFYAVFLLNFQYTSIAYILFAAGILVEIYAISKNKNIHLIYSIILIIIASMIRFDCYYTYVIYIGTYLFIRIINKEKLLKCILVNIIILLLVFILKNFSMNYYINSNPIYKKYYEYNKIRVYHNDLCNITYENNKDIYDKVGWSANDKFLLKNVTIGDEDVFSKENLKNIFYSYMNEKNILDYLKDNYSSYFEKICEIFLTMYAIPFYMCIICILLKGNRKEKNIVFLSCLIQHIIYILIGRVVIRVIYPTYLIAYIIIIFYLDIGFEELKAKILKSNNILKCIIVYVMLISIMSRIPRYMYKKESGKNYYIYDELISYISENKENAYIYPTYSLTNRYIQDSILKLYPKGAYENLFALGSWEIYSKEYYDFKNRYDIENMYKDLIERDNLYLIDSNAWYKDGNIKNIIIFLNEHYYEQEIKYDTIKSIDGKIKIYKLHL